MTNYKRLSDHWLLREFLAACVILVTLFLVFYMGFFFGSQLPPKSLTPTIGEKITALHSYMRDPIIRWAWKQSYCRKDPAMTNMDYINKGK